jgi:hypothetical protein
VRCAPGGDRALEVVDAGQDLAQDVLARLERASSTVLAAALAEVVEIGRGAKRRS